MGFRVGAYSGVAGVLILLTAGLAPAQAGDVGQPAPTFASHDWAGLYLGMDVAGIGAGLDVKGVGRKGKADLKKGGFGMAALAGYNFTSGPWVWGVEGQMGYAGFKKSGAVAGFGTMTIDSKCLSSFVLRGGYAWDNVLLYGKAGVALTSARISSTAGGSSKKTLVGAVAGIGAEYAIDEQWTMRAEALPSP